MKLNLLVALGVVLPVLIWLSAWILERSGLSRLWSYVLGIPLGLWLFIVLGCMSKDFRRALRGLMNLLLRDSERLDFAAARMAAGKAGGVTRVGGLTIWAEQGDNLSACFEAAAEQARAEFAQITGFDGRLERPLRVICFEAEATFAHYMRKTVTDYDPMAGCYSGLLRKRVVLNRELADRPPMCLSGTFAHEVVHHLMRSRLGRLPGPWLSEGLAVLAASRMDDALQAPGAAIRGLRSARSRGELLSGERLLSFSYAELSRRMKDWRDLREACVYGLVYTQSASFLEFLVERHGDDFKRFLSGPARKRHAEKHFAAVFALTPDAAMKQWEDWVLAAEPPAFAAPSDGLRYRVDAELIPLIRDSGRGPDERRRAIRSVGAAGYPWWAAALVDILDDPADEMRDEAQRSLESISGQIHGDAAAWRQWLRSLPPESAGPRP